MWEDYLIYATALGVPKRVIDELKTRGLITETQANLYMGVHASSSGFSGARPAEVEVSDEIRIIEALEEFNRYDSSIPDALPQNRTERSDLRTKLPAVFRKQALKLHPDKGGTEEQFITLQNHYEVLQKALE